MASRLFFQPSILHSRTLFYAGAGASAAFLHYGLCRRAHVLRLDASPSPAAGPKDWSFNQYQADARAPVLTSEGGLNRRAVRQMSAGSIIGLVAGLGFSLFSKPLTLLIGLLIVGVQTAESYLGLHLVPYKRIQGYFKSVDVRSAVQDNIAFKISFGLMFALSAFAEF